MSIKSTFNYERLGSKEEENSLNYDGWEIFAYFHAQSENELINKIEHTFNKDEFWLIKRNNEYFLETDLGSQVIKIIPEELKFKSPFSLKTEKYNVRFTSNTFSIKCYDEKRHQKLCHKIAQKIRKKRIFWVKEGKYFPLHKIIRLIKRKR